MLDTLKTFLYENMHKKTVDVIVIDKKANRILKF